MQLMDCDEMFILKHSGKKAKSVVRQITLKMVFGLKILSNQVLSHYNLMFHFYSS